MGLLKVDGSRVRANSKNKQIMRKWKIELKNYESCFCHSALKDELIFVPQKWEEGGR